MARAIWKGAISFGLVHIPVELYPAESRKGLDLDLLDRRDFAPVGYKRYNKETGKDIDWNDIVKGYEYEKGEFVVLTEEDFQRVEIKATQTIDIQDFVPLDAIDAAFFETPYYLIPQKRATKAYVLLRDALVKKKAAAVATFVLRTKEYLCAVMPVGDALMLEILRFGHELKDAGDMPLPSKRDEADVSKRELDMAEKLIEGMMTEWDPKKYKDRYYRDVMKIIREKAKTGVVKEHHAVKEGTVANDVVDLLDLLKKSVGPRPGVKKTKAKGSKGRKRKAA